MTNETTEYTEIQTFDFCCFFIFFIKIAIAFLYAAQLFADAYFLFT